MAWDFLHIIRQEFQGDSNWGEMYMQTTDKKWEWLCYTYELPWKPDATGKSLNNVSRIQMGDYELFVRTDDPPGTPANKKKGWRLELRKTGHRTNVQIHRAAANMYIEGCILPVHFNTFTGSAIQKGNSIIKTKSEQLMGQIQSRWSTLFNGGAVTGYATLRIAETLPAELSPNYRSTGVA